MSRQQETQTHVERRSSPRVPLDAPFFVTLSKGDRSEPALLVDCSRGGVQLAFSPGANGHADWLSHEVRVCGLPGNMDASDAGVSGMVSWVSKERCGVRFSQPLTISDQELQTLLESL